MPSPAHRASTRWTARPCPAPRPASRQRPAGAAAIDLFWTAPSSNGGASITGYKIETSPDGTSDWTDLVANTNSTGDSYSDTELAPVTARHYRVSAINVNGAGPASGTANAITAPALVSNMGQSSISGVTYGLDAQSSWALGFTTGDNASGYTLTSVQAMVGRSTVGSQVQVSIYDEDSSGGPGSSLYTLTSPDALTGPTFDSGIDANIFTAAANATLEKTTTYFVMFEDLGATGSMLFTDSNAEDAGKANGWSISDKTHSRRGGNASWSEWSDASKPKIAVLGIAGGITAIVPGRPTGLMATANGTTAIDLSWTAPSSDRGFSITGYRIEVSPNGTSSWTNRVANTSTTTTSYAHTGLDAGTTRHYRVSAINANGTGAASSTASATTTTTTTTLSSDATLSALVVNDGTTDHTIDLANPALHAECGQRCHDGDADGDADPHGRVGKRGHPGRDRDCRHRFHRRDHGSLAGRGRQRDRCDGDGRGRKHRVLHGDGDAGGHHHHGARDRHRRRAGDVDAARGRHLRAGRDHRNLGHLRQRGHGGHVRRHAPDPVPPRRGCEQVGRVQQQFFEH